MIRKVDHTVTNEMEDRSLSMGQALEQLKKGKDYLFHRWGLLIFIIGLLLGRAIIVGELMPFAIPFIAVLYHLRRDRVLLASVAVLLGALSHELGAPVVLATSMVMFFFVQKLLERWDRGTLTYTPAAVFISVLLVNWLFAFLFHWTGYSMLMGAVEAGLSLVLTLIFVQSLPFITKERRKAPLKNEELVCLVILLASLMTGTVGWMLMGLSVEHVLARYAILVFAFVAGGAIGATVGVVTGIILSLANVNAMLEMSLLAFSGLLGGLLREGKKLGVAAGLLVGTLLMGLYVGEGSLWGTFNESMLAIALFFLTPNSWLKHISQFIPGTQEHANVQQDYLKRLRDVTASKVEQFSDLFEHLAKSFSAQPSQSEEEKRRHVDLMLSHVTEDTCQVCFKKEQCWKTKFNDTYRLMNDLVEQYEAHGEVRSQQLTAEWSRHCVKSDKVVELMGQELDQYKTYVTYKKKINESQRLVAEQLSGVSQVMNNFAKEIQREGKAHHAQEQQILEALDDIGLSIQHIDIISLEEGNVDIEVSQPSSQGAEVCVKIIAPLLSDIIGEHIIVDTNSIEYEEDGYCKMRLVSAKTYSLTTGVASVAKGGGILSGDSFNTMEVGHGKYAIAIADGMGNGERAHMESNETLSLLQHILQSGIEETVAIKSINSVLSLRSTDEVFSTLDLAMVDLQNAHTRFLKIGSTPSFVKRGEQCLSISAHNLPMGILQDIDVEVVSEQLKAGDLLIMMTDGIYDAPRNIENKERWMKRLIGDIETDDPQQVADLLLEKVIRYHQGQILDDMTVVVAKVERNTPEWSTISKDVIGKKESNWLIS